jgi:hypothetical protein
MFLKLVFKILFQYYFKKKFQGDETLEPDGEATEHDVSTAAESIDPNSESQLHVRFDSRKFL